MKATVIRKTHFNSAHRLNVPNWSEEKNKEFFGPCNNNNFHGHNYELEVSIRGEIHPETGYVYDLGKLNSLIQQEVIDCFDHKNLNLDTAEFKNLNPSAENIAVVIWNKLNEKLGSKFELTITLAETPRNIVIYNGK